MIVLFEQLDNGNPILALFDYSKTSTLTLDLKKQFYNHILINTKAWCQFKVII